MLTSSKNFQLNYQLWLKKSSSELRDTFKGPQPTISFFLFLKLQLSRGRKGFTIVNYGFTVLQFALFLLRFLCFNLTCVFAFLKDFVVCSFHNVCWYGRVATTQMAAPSWCSGNCQRNYNFDEFFSKKNHRKHTLGNIWVVCCVEVLNIRVFSLAKLAIFLCAAVPLVLWQHNEVCSTKMRLIVVFHEFMAVIDTRKSAR